MEVELEMNQDIYYKEYSNLSDIELWINQRDLNKNLVDNIIKGQLEYYKKYKEFTFPGALVVVHFNNKKYLIDGQHRFEALKNLNIKYKHDITVAVQIYVCDNKKQIDELYGMLNHINTNNCMIVDGKIAPDGEKLKQIKTTLKEKYGYTIWDDIKITKPYVNTKILDTELKNSSFFHNKTADEIIAAIQEQNDNYALVLKNTNKTEYNKMMGLGGFVLQCRTPKAKWVQTLF